MTNNKQELIKKIMAHFKANWEKASFKECLKKEWDFLKIRLYGAFIYIVCTVIYLIIKNLFFK